MLTKLMRRGRSGEVYNMKKNLVMF